MKKFVLVGAKVVLDPPRWVESYHRTVEDRAKALERWAQDLQEFIRDHRSQDPVSITVEREYQNQCSHCGREWEEDADGPVCCGIAQEEWTASKTA